MDGAVPCPSPSGHDYLPDQPPVRHGTTATATCVHCDHTITATRDPALEPHVFRPHPAAADRRPIPGHGTW